MDCVGRGCENGCQRGSVLNPERGLETYVKMQNVCQNLFESMDPI